MPRWATRLNVQSTPNDKKSFLCQVETYLGTKEYAKHGRCVRLIGVSIHEYPALINPQSEGVTTFTLELDFWEFFMQELGVRRWWEVARRFSEIDRMESELNGNRLWYRVDLEPVAQSADYFYRTFSEDDPIYVGGKHIQKIDIATFGGSAAAASNVPALRAQPAEWLHLSPQSASAQLLVVHPGGDYVFTAFHVGQGMCSLVHDGSTGILLDAGAGKPVTRGLYLDMAKPMKNDLRDAVAPLSLVGMVASHTDYDHWKLLAWDPALLAKIQRILVPENTDHLLFKDQAIINKCRGTRSGVIKLAPDTTLTLHRAAPSHSDANGNCLVAVFNRDGQQVLAPGDYVYSRFKTDGSGAIQDLLAQVYEAVIVPHHGDKASADDVVTPASTDSKAFFSAGTHQGYNHPTDESKDAHIAANFVQVLHCDKPFILEVPLL